MGNVSYYIIIIFVAVILLSALIKKKDAYNSFIKGATESLKLGITIIPYLLVMYVAVATFKASNLMNDLIHFQTIPSELFIQGTFRPVSSHASLSVMMSIISEFGVDSKVGITSAILQGGSDTTVFVMGLYFGTIGIKKTRHAYPVGIICDIICFILCILLFLFIL